MAGDTPTTPSLPEGRLPGRATPSEALPGDAIPPGVIPGTPPATETSTPAGDTTTPGETTYTTVAADLAAVRGSARSFSPLDICNMALAQAGSTQMISALFYGDDAVTPLESRLCAMYWPLAFEAVARSHDWKCLEKLANISGNLTNAPAHTYAYAFVLPGDCLRVLDLTEDIGWERSGWLLLTDTSTPEIRYIRRTDDTSVFDALFVQSLVQALAALLAMALTHDDTRKERLDAWLQRVVLPLARFVDSTEQSVQTLESTTWINSRR